MTMQALIEAFPDHIHESLNIAEEQALSFPNKAYSEIMISGLGGSGIGATIVSNWAAAHASLPVIVNKEYRIPAFVGPNTFFIASSYSGNTEETLQAVQEAHKAGATVVCITSGGKLAELAKAHGWGLRTIPGGNPPRACLGYSLTQLVTIFVQQGWLPSNYMGVLKNAANRLKESQAQVSQKAQEIAARLDGTLPVIYAETLSEGIAVRFRQQINENAKMLCWHHIVPEMNHNEMVGWADKHPEILVVSLRNPSDFKRNRLRMDIAEGIFKQREAQTLSIESSSEHPVEQALEHIHLGDWVSLHLARLRGADEMEVHVIDFLKGELSKH